MIYGLGIDIISVHRLREVVERWGRRFLERVFTSGEISYCLSRLDPYPSLSARFAAKEAMVKAVGCRNLRFKDIEVLNIESGKPIINPGIGLREKLDSIGIRNIHLSLSHDSNYSVACVVLEH